MCCERLARRWVTIGGAIDEGHVAHAESALVGEAAHVRGQMRTQGRPDDIASRDSNAPARRAIDSPGVAARRDGLADCDQRRSGSSQQAH